jgi:hypothetical protein
VTGPSAPGAAYAVVAAFADDADRDRVLRTMAEIGRIVRRVVTRDGPRHQA